MLMFWQPEMSLWESGTTNVWLKEKAKPPIRFFSILLVSQLPTVGQGRYDPCPWNKKSVQQHTQYKIQVSYRIWVSGTRLSVSSHSTAILSKFVVLLQNPAHAEIIQGLWAQRDESQASGGWHCVGWDLVSLFFSIQYIHNISQLYWTLL